MRAKLQFLYLLKLAQLRNNNGVLIRNLTCICRLKCRQALTRIELLFIKTERSANRNNDSDSTSKHEHC